MKKLLLIACLILGCLAANAQKAAVTKNVVIVTLDGMRWQEVFRGADSALIQSDFTNNKKAITTNFWAATATERRKLLFPFLWNKVVEDGQIYGNRDIGGQHEVANAYRFSYPGYNEIFTGYPDARMNTNDAINNPNMNVLEFINKQKGFEGKVVTFASWERFPQILNVHRSGLPVYSGYVSVGNKDAGARLQYLNELQHKVPHYLGDSTRLDFITYEFAKEYIKQYKPRVTYIAFDETDDMAHAGNYEFYLQRAKQEDGFLQELWNMLQADAFYKDNTTLIITCDHGRGEQPLNKWRDHGADVKGAEQTWFAIIGPGIAKKGEVKGTAVTYHKQLAQTIATLLGLNFKAAAGHPVADAIPVVIN